MILLPVFFLLFATPDHGISITTRDSTTIRQGTYSSLFFVAGPGRPPASIYQISESGEPPPGMIFEPYPCNKPDMKVCQAMASANGVYLDGVPTEPGSYKVVITAVNLKKKKASRQFTIVVEPRNGQGPDAGSSPKN